MLVTCSYCNRLHNRGEKCSNRPVNNSREKESTYITRFRATNIWKKKRNEIKERDKFLCQYCLKNGKYTFTKLSVHHIRPISKAWHKRLDNGNLITLCSLCHKMSEDGNIKRAELYEIVAKTADTF